MDPYLQQILTDEVIYLHSLWRQGPPTNPNRPTSAATRPDPIPAPTTTDTTNKKRKTEFPNNNNKKPSPPPDPDPRWLPAPPKPKPNLVQPTAEEIARHRALRLHAPALDACKVLFSGEEEDDEEEEEEEDDVVLDEYSRGTMRSEEYNAMLNLFVENEEMRKYYEERSEDGEFYCFVCGGLGKTKKFKGCGGVMQHSVSIKSKKKRAHRDFARVLSKVMGWDFYRLPTIVLRGERLGVSLAKQQIEPNADSSEKEAFDDPQSNGKELKVVLLQKSLIDDGRENTGSFDIGAKVAEKEAIQENSKDARGEPDVSAGSSEGVLWGVQDYVTAGNDVKDKLGEQEALDVHQNNGENQMISQEALDIHQNNGENKMISQNSIKDDGINESTKGLGKGIAEVEANNEDAVDTGGEVPENADGQGNSLLVSKNKLDHMSCDDGEIGSKEEPVVGMNDAAPLTCQLQDEPEKKADGNNDDLNVFLENLEPL